LRPSSACRSVSAPIPFYDLIVWVRLKLYQRDRNFQRFHIARMAEREALKPVPDRPGRTN